MRKHQKHSTKNNLSRPYTKSISGRDSRRYVTNLLVQIFCYLPFPNICVLDFTKLYTVTNEKRSSFLEYGYLNYGLS